MTAERQRIAYQATQNCPLGAVFSRQLMHSALAGRTGLFQFVNFHSDFRQILFELAHAGSEIGLIQPLSQGARGSPRGAQTGDD